MPVSSRVIAFILLVSSSLVMAKETQVVYPTGLFPDDLENVQSVVDDFGSRGVDGIVILKAQNSLGVPTAFNFGTDADPSMRGSVFIGSSHAGAIEFRGEHAESGHTVIMGGFVTIHMQRSDRLTVRNVEFRGAYQHAIFVQMSTGVIIEDNVFQDTEGFVDTFPLTRVIYFESLNFDPENIAGKIDIHRNYINGAIGFFTDGISSFWTHADTFMSHNVVTGVNVAIRHDAYFRPVHISRNQLDGIVPREFFFGAGIEIGCAFGSAAKANVTHNYITAEDPFAPTGFATGIAVFGADAELFGIDNGIVGECPVQNSTFMHNDITLIDAFDALDIGAFAINAGSVTGNNFSQNTVRGTAYAGIFAGGFDLSMSGMALLEVSKNKFINNNFSELEVLDVDVFLDPVTSKNKLVLNRDDTFLDLGSNNSITVNNK